MIMPLYQTDFSNQNLTVKINIIKSLINFLLHLNERRLAINDLKADNIGFLPNGNIILIDFDRTTINDIFSYQLIIPNYINNNILEYRRKPYSGIFDKLYSSAIAEFIYLIAFKDQPPFIETFLQKNASGFMFVPINDTLIQTRLNDLVSNPINFLYYGFETILLDEETNKGLLANDYANIYTYSEVLQLLDKIKILNEDKYFRKYLKYKNKYLRLLKYYKK
jgi:hypothetical protein